MDLEKFRTLRDDEDFNARRKAIEYTANHGAIHRDGPVCLLNFIVPERKQWVVYEITQAEIDQGFDEVEAAGVFDFPHVVAAINLAASIARCLVRVADDRMACRWAGALKVLLENMYGVHMDHVIIHSAADGEYTVEGKSKAFSFCSAVHVPFLEPDWAEADWRQLPMGDGTRRRKC